MSEHKRIKCNDREYEMWAVLCQFYDDDESGEQVIGPIDYMWGRDGSETLDPSEAVKVATISGEEIVLHDGNWIRVEYSQNSLWNENPSHSQPTDDTLGGEFTEEEIAEVRKYAERYQAEYKSAAAEFNLLSKMNGLKAISAAYTRLASIAEHLAGRE